MKASGARRSLAVRSLLLGGLIWASPARVGAEPADDGRTGEFVVGVRVSPLFVVGEVCEHSGDTIGCTTGVGVLGPELFVRVPLVRALSLGPRAFLGFEAGERGADQSDGQQTALSRRLLLLDLDARYQAQPRAGFWVAGQLGVAALQDVVDVQATAAGDSSQVKWAPKVGGNLGYELAFAQGLSLGLGLRLDYLAFSAPDNPQSGTTTYGNLYSAGLLVELSWGP